MKGSRLAWLSCGIACLLVWPAHAADRRVALVIGNSKYPEGYTLANPANDAQAVAAALRGLDFQVIEKIDLAKKKDMDDALLEFHQALRGGGVGLFYYAGHGVQVGGQNYLLPTQENFRAEYEVKSGGLRADDVLLAMEEGGATLNVLVLDCCRDAPFTRSWSRSAGAGSGGGLSAMSAPKGTLIAFSTKAGATAADGQGGNSPYTEQLLVELAQRPAEGLEIKRVFQKTAERVFDKTQQDPGLYLSGSFRDYFLIAGTGVPGGNAGTDAERQRLAEENAKLKADLARIQGEVDKGQSSSQLLADLKKLQERMMQLESRSTGPAPVPTPVPTDSFVPVPTKASATVGNQGLTASEQEALKTFIVGFVRSGESDDPRANAGYFAPTVANFYGEVNRSHADIMASHVEYVRKYPRRSYQPTRYAVTRDEGGTISVEAVVRFAVSGVNSRSGVSTSTIDLRRKGGTFEILSINEKVDFD